MRSLQVGGKKREWTRRRCDLSKMCTASLMLSPPSSTSLSLIVANTPRQERYHDELAEEETQLSRPSFTQYQTPRRTPASSLILRTITPSSNSRRFILSNNKSRTLLSGSLQVDRPECFDLLVCLPLEVSVLILDYLDPKDLCQVCQVSHGWYQLSHHPPLLKQRRTYIKALKEEYQLSKENFPPSLRNSSTPQQPSFASSRQMTIAQSPLNLIQPRNSSSSGRQRQRQTSAPTQLASPPSGQTPCPAYLLEDVRKLSLDDGVVEVRRCLFPTAEISPTHKSLTRTLWNQRNAYKCMKGDLMAGKKANRSRLRRL